MSLYIIEDRYGALRDSSVNYNYAKSLQQSRYPDCHIVELVPAKPKVQVSQEEADMLEKAKYPTIRPSFEITEYSDSHKGYILGNDLEDRLMDAYVNGYTVAKDKRYLVELDGLVTTDNAQQYLTKKDGKWFASRRMPGLHQDFTDKELNAAPEWAQKLNREEVTDDDE